MKMIDVWLIFCLVVPFLEVILRTVLECLSCSCDICEGKVVKRNNADGREKKVERNAVQVLVGTGGKVAPEQVNASYCFSVKDLICRAKAEEEWQQ